MCNLPTSVICVELAFCTLLNIPHPTTEAIIPFLLSRKVVRTRKASMNLARVRINVSSPSGKGEAGRRKCVYSSGFSATCSLRAMLWGVKLSLPVPKTMPGPRKLRWQHDFATQVVVVLFQYAWSDHGTSWNAECFSMGNTLFCTQSHPVWESPARDILLLHWTRGSRCFRGFSTVGRNFADCQPCARPFCVFQVCTRCWQPLCKADVTDCHPRAEGGAERRERLARACPTVSDGAGVLHTQAVLVQMRTSFPTAVTQPSNASLRLKGKVCSQFGRDFQEGCPDHGWDFHEKDNLDFFFL